MKKLTSKNVEETFVQCLFRKGEDTSTAVMAAGVKLNVGFNPDRLKEAEEDVKDYLKQLSPRFLDSASFLNACEDRDGILWTGLHSVMDNLVCLGIAIGKVEYAVPRDKWKDLPGGMPNLTIKV